MLRFIHVAVSTTKRLYELCDFQPVMHLWQVYVPRWVHQYLTFRKDVTKLFFITGLNFIHRVAIRNTHSVSPSQTTIYAKVTVFTLFRLWNPNGVKVWRSSRTEHIKSLEQSDRTSLRIGWFTFCFHHSLHKKIQCHNIHSRNFN